MADPPDANPYSSPDQSDLISDVVVEVVEPRPWGFWATTGWTLLSGLVYLFAAIAVIVVFVVIHAVTQGEAAVERFLEESERNGLLLAIAAILGVVPCVGVLAAAAKLRGWTVAGYFALKRLRLGQTLEVTGLMLALIVAFDGLTYALGRDIVTDFMVEAYETAGFLPLLIVALVIAAPLGEELVFRGFMYRGFAATLGVWPTIFITSLLWAALHTQYEAYFIAQIFLLGLILGVIRQRTGSTTLPILAHAVHNTYATAQVVIYVEWLQ